VKKLLCVFWIILTISAVSVTGHAVSFSGNEPMTRVLACEIVAEKLDLPVQVPESSPFADFGPEDDGYVAAVTCKQLGIINSVWATHFKPDTVLRREEVAEILCNAILGPTAAKQLTADVAPFNDVPLRSAFDEHPYDGYIAYCAEEGLMEGYSDGSFKPKEAAKTGDVNWLAITPMVPVADKGNETLRYDLAAGSLTVYANTSGELRYRQNGVTSTTTGAVIVQQSITEQPQPTRLRLKAEMPH